MIGIVRSRIRIANSYACERSEQTLICEHSKLVLDSILENE